MMFLEVEVHSIWILWIKRPSRMEGTTLFLEVGGTGSFLRSGSEIFDFIFRGLPERRGPRPFPLKVRRGRLASLLEVNGIQGVKFHILQIM